MVSVCAVDFISNDVSSVTLGAEDVTVATCTVELEVPFVVSAVDRRRRRPVTMSSETSVTVALRAPASLLPIAVKDTITVLLVDPTVIAVTESGVKDTEFTEKFT